MKILGIDTTTKILAIGIYDGAKIYEYNLELGRRQSDLLIPTIKRLLEALKWQLADIDYFACGLGPGSFTGIRVGLSTIKGLSFVSRKPVIGISTLDIIAANAPAGNSVIVPVIDAKRNLIFSSSYKNINVLKKITPYTLWSVDELCQKNKPNSVFLGDALDLYKEAIKKYLSGAKFLEKDYWYPKGRQIIALALEKIKQKKAKDTFSIEPIYLYPKECQIKQAKN